ncbi:MAG: undecaprenyldiphospho-muramoylpentapeptide beta-N-acetylglucosaminyltransferase [Sphingomicrobium sp.]
MNFTLAAGGTGGHMVPAHALAAELKARGHGVMLITDDRGARFPGLFENVPVHILPAGRLGGGPIGWVKAARSVLVGRSEAKRLYREHRPDAVIGFGGYPAFPSLIAASAMRIPTLLHEQNAVLGRVNRLLAGETAAIATAFDEIERLKPRHRSKTVLIGNPVREAVAKLGEVPFPAFDEYAPLRILVTGGSQGASILGQVVPDGLGQLDPSLRRRLQIMQQCRPDDIARIRERYAELGIPAELTTYIEDMPARLGDAHLVIGRAGASTIAELTAAGRPAILIPFGAATDDHQTANAREMTNAGGARCIAQANFKPDVLARQIEALAADPQALANAAARALSVGRPHAARDLADLVERIGQGLAPVEVGPAAIQTKVTGFATQGVPA